MRAWAGLVLLSLLSVGLAGCTAPGPAAPGPTPGTSPGGTPNSTPIPAPTRAPPPSEAEVLALARTFDGAKALRLVTEQVQPECPAQNGSTSRTCTRYRVTGTEGNSEMARELGHYLTGLGLGVTWDNFTAHFDGRELAAHNLIAERRGTGSKVLYLGAHYDTRPCADKDANPANRTLPIPGANDGASGVAVLAELASALGTRSLNFTLRFVFFDAEDLGDGGLGCGQGSTWAQGSAHYAARLSDAEINAAKGLVLLDMVGDRNLTLRREGNSLQPPHRAMEDDVWRWAGKLNHAQFVNDNSVPILDDHAGFQKRGMPAIDVIHLDDVGRDLFPDTHHTMQDDLDHISTASLVAVGETLFAAVISWDALEG